MQHTGQNYCIFSRVFQETQGIGIMIACVNKNKKVDKKPNSIQEEISETQIGFSDNQ